MRKWIIPFCLLVFVFFLPLQCFIIGDNQGLGIQGAVYRYQITGNGISLIPVTHEIGYVMNGIYQGKTALSVILWGVGTLVLVCTLLLSFIRVNRINHPILHFTLAGTFSSCILYLGSLVFQYGILFSGPAGISLPVGILMMALFVVFLFSYENIFLEPNN